MKKGPVTISEEELDRQQGFAQQVRQFYMARLDRQHLALTDTYGCQQNEADTELLRGMLVDMGFGFTDDPEKADLILLNTCAIREHAEQRGVRQCGGSDPCEAAAPGLGGGDVRLHGPAVPCAGQSEKELSGGGPFVRHPCAL